jgi:glucose-6-phosphate 1-dehydrogenase
LAFVPTGDTIQAYEGIVLRFQAKQPGPKMHLRSVEMQLNYQATFAVASCLFSFALPF